MLAAIVVLVNLPVLHLLVRRPAGRLRTRALLRRLLRPGHGGAQLPLARRLPTGHQRRAALARDQEQPAVARRRAPARRGGRGLRPAHQPRRRDPGDALRERAGRRHRLPGHARPWSPMGSPARLGPSLVRLDENGATLSRWLSPRARSRRPALGGLRQGLGAARRGDAGHPRPGPRLPDALRAPRLGAALDGGRPADGRAGRPVPAHRAGARPARALQRRVGRLLRRPPRHARHERRRLRPRGRGPARARRRPVLRRLRPHPARPGLARHRPGRRLAPARGAGGAERPQPPGVAPEAHPGRRGHRPRRLDRQPRRRHEGRGLRRRPVVPPRRPRRAPTTPPGTSW